MKKVIFSAFALLLVVAISSCRETTEVTVEDQNVDAVKEEPAAIDISETIQVEVVADSTKSVEQEAKQ